MVHLEAGSASNHSSCRPSSVSPLEALVDGGAAYLANGVVELFVLRLSLVLPRSSFFDLITDQVSNYEHWQHCLPIVSWLLFSNRALGA